MSEVDGAYTEGTNAGEMSAALGLAKAMMKDVNGLNANAWILWNAIDMHVDKEIKPAVMLIMQVWTSCIRELI